LLSVFCCNINSPTFTAQMQVFKLKNLYTMFALVFLIGLSAFTTVSLPAESPHSKGKQTEYSKQTNQSLAALTILDLTLEDEFIDEEVEDDEVNNHKAYNTCASDNTVLVNNTQLKSAVNTHKKNNSLALFILYSALKIPFSI
jgi:hypothetical protein